MYGTRDGTCDVTARAGGPINSDGAGGKQFQPYGAAGEGDWA